MKNFLKNLISRVISPAMLIAVIVGSSLPVSVFAALSADIKVNGSDGPVTINSTESFTYSWSSTDATACQMTSPITSGVTLSGTGAPLNPGDQFYPAVGSSVTLTLVCTDGTNNSTDSVTVNVVGSTPPPPAAAPTADIKVNGQDGTVTIAAGTSFTYTWTSTDATACQATSPITSGITLSGTSAPMNPGDQYYPTASTPTVLTIVCTNGTQNATDSVTVQLASSTPPPTGGAPTVDVDANGSDGPVTISSGDSYTYTWTSTNATACQMTSPVTSGVSISGTSSAITPGTVSFYPATNSPVTITITCTNGTANATDSVVINLSGGGGGGGGAPTVDVKANGQDGTVTITNGDSYTYTWTSANATACQMTSPVNSGVSISGSNSVSSGMASFYPVIGSPVTITVICTNGSSNATDSVVVQVVNPSSGGGGGGGGGGSSSRPSGTVLAGTTECPWIRDYMRIDFVNDPTEVMKLQAFLKVFMGYDYVTVNGVFDQATYTAVGQFQMTYRDEILTPWGHTAPTHYVYILTLKKINEIYCQNIMPLTTEQVNEILTFRNLINTMPASVPTLPATGVGPTDEATTTLPQVGIEEDKGQNLNGLAAALFTFPDNVRDTMQCVYEFALILVVLYILGSVLKDVLYNNVPENRTKRTLVKWVSITVGLLAAMVLAFVLREFCLMLPLLVSTLASMIWLSSYPKHETVLARIKGFKVRAVPQP
jgi:hypothetical protein